MRRLELLSWMLLLTAVCICMTVFFSPYAPVVGGTAEIQTLWDIEDMRTESETPLITALENHGVPLAYDRSENTFYCPLGMDNGESWPELKLTAPGAKGTTICFSDDYTYDYCAEAIAEGYAYELMAYTDELYGYFSIVFTGLPVISLETQTEIGAEDVPVRFEMGSPQGALTGPARAHLRGDSGLVWSGKHGYRIEFTREADGTKKVARTVPGFMDTDAILLLPMAFDDTLMRDRLSWEMYALISPGEESFGARKAQYVELFIDGGYEGVYLMLEPLDVYEELKKSGASAAATDSVYRTAVLKMEKDRPVMEDVKCNGWGYEAFYTPDEQEAFRALDRYFDVWTEEGDDAFVSKAQAHMDVRDVVRYTLFAQAAGLADNAHNNLFIWAHEQDGRMTYRYRPWDMDRSWGIDAGHAYDYWFLLSVADRMINLNAGGAREMALDIWLEMENRGFTVETVKEKTDLYTRELNESGAAVRNAMRWDLNNAVVDGYYIVSYCEIRFALMERICRALAADNAPYDFLCGDLSTDELIIRPIRLNDENTLGG